MTLRYFVSIKRFRTNPLYASIGYREFVKNTTNVEVKRALKTQAFWDKAFRLGPVSSVLGSRLVEEQRQRLLSDRTQQISRLEIKRCAVSTDTTMHEQSPDSTIVESAFSVVSGSLGNAAMSVGIEIENWNKENFICAPGASYNAGRFERHRTIYPPFLPKEKWHKEVPIITSEIPGLQVNQIRSQMDLLMSEICAPMIGIWLKEESTCIWIISNQQSAIGENGFSIKEDLNLKKLSLELMTPIVREHKAAHGASKMPSWDKGARIKKGDQANIGITVHQFSCESFHDFYAAFRNITYKQEMDAALCTKVLPLSAAWNLIEPLYNNKKWSEQYGYYHAGFLPPFIDADTWSAGWTGGLALSYALLNRGNELSQQRALRNLAFFFSENGQSNAGIFYATSDGKDWGGDNYFAAEGIGSKDWIHVRRCGDYLYFVIKHFRLLDARGQSNLISPEWKEKTIHCADALCQIWRDNRNFGQYINPQTLDIRIGNSDAGNIVPAALAECAAYFGRADYLDIATDSLHFYYADFQHKGFTAGGPLEILCAPDSESAINLLESLVTVYERTQDAGWLSEALSYCNYIATWFYSYDVAFPAGTAYQKLGVRTTGSIMASSQNRCAVPNICTLSGDAFWRLYRYTGDQSVMRLLVECVHNTQQYLSRKDNPIRTVLGEALPDGTIHECIQTGDWTGPTGEIPYQYPTSWAEVAHLLSICELPGIYLQLGECRLSVIDHLDVSIVDKDDSKITLRVSNPTAHQCTTSLYAESNVQTKQLPEMDLMDKAHCINIPARAVVICTIDRTTAVVEALR
ncbi:MAG: hypothetical protein ACK4SX_10750 [Alcanivoracaceae bacterium]